MWFTRLAISRPIVIWMALAAIAVLGIRAYTRLPAELNPRVSIPTVTVTTVDDGQQAIDAVKRGERFDAIILDAMMPKVGGREAYEQIRALDSEPAFLFSSGYAADLFPASVLSELGVELLQKPYDPDLLLRVVRRTLDGRSKESTSR